MEFNIDLKQFEGIEFNADEMATYVEFWNPYMVEMELTNEQKNELVKAWQILAIEYAKDVGMYSHTLSSMLKTRLIGIRLLRAWYVFILLVLLQCYFLIRSVKESLVVKLMVLSLLQSK